MEIIDELWHRNSTLRSYNCNTQIPSECYDDKGVLEADMTFTLLIENNEGTIITGYYDHDDGEWYDSINEDPIVEPVKWSYCPDLV